MNLVHENIQKQNNMERKNLLNEYKVTLESLVEKTKFVYSEEFYKLDEFERKKYINDKMATEGHLSTLCNVLWGNTPQLGGLADMMGFAIISSMLGNSFGFPSSSQLPKPNIESEELHDAN